MAITIDYLPLHPEIKVYQDDEMFRMNTDTAVLGEFIQVFREEEVLDIGTNQGALLLYASFFYPKKMTGIDVNEKALELAKMNCEAHVKTPYELICADAITYTGTPVDVIICNPPYFQTKNNDKGKNPYLSLAKHEGALSLPLLANTIDRNLKANGKLFFLYQTSRLDEVMREFAKHHMHTKILKFVYDEQKEYSNVVLMKIMKGVQSGLIVEKPIVIDRSRLKERQS